MDRLNCWEVQQCGRGPDASAQDICPAALAQEFNGVNQGFCAGRFCWAVSKTLCYDRMQGTMAEKAMNCMECQFYGQVVQEHRGENLIINPNQL